MRNTVTGAFRQKAKTREIQARASVAKKEEAATPMLAFMQIRYTSQPKPPVIPQQSHSWRGV